MKRFKLNELEQARIYARENDMYICLYIVKGYIECRKLNREERVYIACDILFNSKGKVVYNDIERLDV